MTVDKNGTNYVHLWTLDEEDYEFESADYRGYVGPIKIDKTAPTIKVSENIDDINKPHTLDITITVEGAGDSGLSSRNEYKYYLALSISNVETDGIEGTYTSGTKCTIGEGLTGQYYLYVYQISDNVGNQSSTDFTITSTRGQTYHRFGPYTFDNSGPDYLVPADDTRTNWSPTKDIKVYLYDTAGIAEANVTFDWYTTEIKGGTKAHEGVEGSSGDQRWIFSYSSNAKRQGYYYLGYTVNATDLWGNTTTKDDVVGPFHIDKVNPSTPTLRMAKGSVDGDTYSSDEWSNEDVYITPTANDGTGSYTEGTKGSGVSHYEYSTDNTTWKKVEDSAFSISAEGTTTIYVKAVDNCGNESEVTTATIQIKKTPLEVATMTFTKADGTEYTPGENNWSTQNINLTLSDNTEDTTTTYTIDGQETTETAITTEGTHTIVITTTDDAGNTATREYIVNIDITLPIPATMTFTKDNETAYTPGDNKWSNKDITLTLNNDATDEGSGVASTTYTIDGEESTETSITTEGTHTIEVTTTDNAGISSTNKYTVNIDKTAPTGTILVPSATNQDSFVISYTDMADVGGSGLSFVYYAVCYGETDDPTSAEWLDEDIIDLDDTTTSKEIELEFKNALDGNSEAQEGVYTYTAEVGDLAGNCTTITTGNIIYDVTAPTQTREILTMKLGDANGSDYTGEYNEDAFEGNWTNQDVYVAINATNETATDENGSGVNTTTWQIGRYRLDENSQLQKEDIITPTTAFTTLTEEGIYIVGVTTTDFAGNKSSRFYAMLIDKTIPTIAMTVSASSTSQMPSIILTATDEGGSELSENNSYQYQLGTSNIEAPTGTWQNYTSGAEFTIGEGLTGDYYLWVKTISDNAGNKSADAEYSVVSEKFTFKNEEDVTPPELSIGYSITQLTNQSITVTITANEEVKNVEGWTISEDGKTLTKTYTSNTTENIDVYDLAGNKTTIQVKIENIDNVKPILNVDYSKTQPTNQSVTVTITANEEVQEVEGWTLSADKKVLTKEYADNTNEEITVKDLVGNEMEATISIKNIDKVAPEVTTKYSTQVQTKESVTVTLEANEQLQQLEGWTISGDGTTLTKIYTENANENITVKDLAGNTTTISINITNIDTTELEVSVEYSTTKLTNKNVTATIKANKQVQEIEGWTLSTDKKTLTKEYAENTNETVTIKDSVGNQREIKISVQNIDKVIPKVNVKYSTLEKTNKGITVSITADENLQTLEGWTLEETGKTLTKIYTANITESVDVYDLAGNKATAKITINNIDTTRPTIEVKYSTTESTTEDVIVTIVSNEQLQKVDGWEIGEDGKTLTKKFDKNSTEMVKVYDLAGNETEIQISITNINKTNTQEPENNNSENNNQQNNNSGNNNSENKNPSDTAQTTIPHAGSQALSGMLIIAIIVSIILWTKNRKFEDIR